MSTATAFMPLFENFVFETVSCYSCGSASSKEFIVAQDDLTGKPGSIPKPSNPNRSNQILLRRRVHRAPQEDRLGASHLVLQLGDG